MDRARHDLLAGASLTSDQDRAGRRRHGLEGLEEFPHWLAATDDPAEVMAFLGPKVGDFVLEPAQVERLLQDVHELVELKRLLDKIRGALLDRIDGILDRSVARDDNGDDGR